MTATATDEPPRCTADGGVTWRTALFAVGVALLPSAITLGIWLGTGESNDPEPALDPLSTDMIMQIYLQSQLDPDECMADFAATAHEPSSARLPFYFC